MFNIQKRLRTNINHLVEHLNIEIKKCDECLIDLPSDIKNLKELDLLMHNNKDMTRAYDLGRKEALYEIKNILVEI